MRPTILDTVWTKFAVVVELLQLMPSLMEQQIVFKVTPKVRHFKLKVLSQLFFTFHNQILELHKSMLCVRNKTVWTERQLNDLGPRILRGPKFGKVMKNWKINEFFPVFNAPQLAIQILLNFCSIVFVIHFVVPYNFSLGVTQMKILKYCLSIFQKNHIRLL